MKILIDMNLSPEWVAMFRSHDIEAVHWSNVGAPDARDEEIMFWARTNARVVFTHDLDFGTVLALTNAAGPSVIQIRTQDIMPRNAASKVMTAINSHLGELERGALVVIDDRRSRVRILPLR